LLISDLIDTSGADVVAVAAKAPGGRVHVALPAAPEQAERADLAIRARVRTALAPAGEAIPVDVRLTQRGLEGQPVTVTIRQTAPVVATLAERTLTPRRNDAIS